MILRNFRHWLCAICLMTCATVASGQTNIPPVQVAAEEALVSGDPARAATLAQSILAENPDDFAALFILALAQADLGDETAAAATASRAYAVAPDEAAKLQSARLVASNRFALRQYMRGEFWLRRAVNHAQTEEDFEAVAREYVATVNANPLTLQFTASIAPSDNINDGSEDGILNFETIGFSFLLPENRRALSGIAYAGSARFEYRLAEGPNQRTSLTGTISGETFTLSQEAKDLLASSPSASVREVEGRDFATLLAEIGITRSQSNISPLGPVSLGLNYGTFWEAGTRVVDYRDIIVQQLIPINDRNALNIRASVRDQTAVAEGLVDSKTYDVIGTYSRALVSRDQLQLSLAWRQSDAGFENSYEEYRTGINYGLNDPIFGVRLSTSLEVGFRTYEEFVTTLDGRDDKFITAQANMIFEEFTYFGFSPSMSVSATRNESTAEEETSSAFQVLVGIESNF